jgi:hypothetical protein
MIRANSKRTVKKEERNGKKRKKTFQPELKIDL